MSKKYQRKVQGSALVELAPALGMIFLLFAFPLMLFCSWSVQYGLLANAVHTAAAHGARCKSFYTDVDSGDPSATTLAKSIINSAAKMTPSISITQISTYIVIYPLSGGSPTTQSTALTSPAITSSNAYNFKVSVTAQISPFVTCPTTFVGNIPGITAPFTTTVNSSAFFESTQNLTQ